jgi:hypothetical protein
MRTTTLVRHLLLASLLVPAACTALGESLAKAYIPYDSFAQTFIRDFQASGLDGVRERVKANTLRGDGPRILAKMRQDLPATVDSTRAFGDASVEEESATGLAHLYYHVYGPGRVTTVELWVERSGRNYVVETIRVKPSPPAP